MSVSWNSKKECRSYFKSLCVQEATKGLVQKQQQLNVHLREFMNSRKGVWGAYRALNEEAQVEEVFHISHVSWVFPRICGAHLEFFSAQDFVPGPFKILEPSLDSARMQLPHIQGLLIPGLAFKKNGNRLGKGKGFYDKTLDGYQGLRVGVCFDFQVTDQLPPVEAHDVRMDYLITESGIIDCTKYQE